MKNTLQKILLAACSGTLLVASWPMNGFPALAFLAWIPLMHLLENGHQSGWNRPFLRAMGWSFVALLIWNAGTTWWLFYASIPGAIAAILLNSVFMSLIIGAAHTVRAQFNLRKGLMAWVALWIGWEYVHLRWDLSWPWLTLGHVFSENPEWVQWYEYTGVLGGSTWVLGLNVAVYYAIRKWSRWGAIGRSSAVLGVIGAGIGLPLWFSSFLFQVDAQRDAALAPSERATLSVIQPNIDPYTEKFNINNANSAQNLLFLIRDILDDHPDFVLIPETALPNGFDETQWDTEVALKILASSHRKRQPETELVVGATTYLRYPTHAAPPLSARALPNNSGWYDVFNTAFHQRRDSVLQYYHKSKLVVGVEMTPFQRVIKPVLGEVLIDLGGTSSSLGMQAERSVFTHANGRVAVAPIICYESIYGEYASGYVQNGANVFGVITNDGWWSDSPGHRQHFSLARLMAISHRRAIARSANTGISGFISPRGEVLETLPYNTRGALSRQLPLRTEITWYAIYGDVLGRLFGWMGIFFLLYARVQGIRNPKPSRVK